MPDIEVESMEASQKRQKAKTRAKEKIDDISDRFDDTDKPKDMFEVKKVATEKTAKAKSPDSKKAPTTTK